uniref:Obscurin like cytoskeletal adaptor 1a n=1 Tax=Scophthalmus maximus TaxID=52904 RepID=A0A8D3BUK5_SCOMX
MDIFGGAPRVLGYPRPVVAQCHADATLRCQIGGDPRPDVIWERKNVQISSEGRYKLSEEGKAFLLTITGVTQQDAGQYICKARNSVGETYAAASLKVEGEAQTQEGGQRQLGLISDDKPRFLIKPLSLRVDRGEDAAFSCKIWGTPLPEVTWEKDGKKLNDIFESSHFSVSIQDGGWFQLKVYRTRMPDKGVYTCKAVNCNGGALAGAILLVEPVPEREDGKMVKEEPRISSSAVKKFAVAEGKHAKFRCFVTGKPKPEIVWKKNGVPLEPGRRHLIFEDREGYYTLKVLYCKEQDTGLYVCAASNTLGNTLSAVHLSVKGPAVRFRRPLKDVEVRERDIAVLECEMPEESVPAAWYLEDQRLVPSSKYGMEQKGTKRRLTIHDVGTDDDGVYLCEMPDGGKSIAELSVKGAIVRKLPRKLEVLEGENAVFCVEVEDDELDVHWFKDGLKLHETHQTILKSFGKTHILVFVNVAYQDSGVVTFVTGRSKTSSRLKVKASRHCPPICPVGVTMDADRPNSALLTWVPSPNSPTSSRSIFVLERQEVGSQEWLKCHTSETATSAEVGGDSVPCEGDYRFRVCCINKYGRSGHVEFPKAGCELVEGEDAHFSIELSASMVGTWFLNSAQLQHGGRYLIQQLQTQHSLVIRDTCTTEDTAEVTFIANGVRDSAVLKVKRSPVSELDSNKRVETGDAIVLYCEVSHPCAKVSWFKDGEEIKMTDGLNIQSDGNMRRIVIQSADVCHSGVYTCETSGDRIKFNVGVAEPLVTIVEPKDDAVMESYVSEEIRLQCELSRTSGKVQWFKDGQEVEESDNIQLISEGPYRRLTVPCGTEEDGGEYVCKTDGDSVFFQLTVTVRIVSPSQAELELSHLASERLELSCEISQADAPVRWYRDGLEVDEGPNLILEVDGAKHRLVIPVTTVDDTGEYICDTEDDSVAFLVTVTEAPVKILRKSEMKTNMKTLLSDDIVLECELSRASAVAKWYKDGCRIEGDERFCEEEECSFRSLVILNAELRDSGEYFLDVGDDSITFQVTVEGKIRLVDFIIGRKQKILTQAFLLFCYGTLRKIIITNVQPSDSGKYICDAVDDRMISVIRIQEPPVVFLNKEDDIVPLRDTVAHADGMVTLRCEVCKPKADVQWLQNGAEVVPGRRFSIRADGVERSLTIHRLTREDAGEYTCESRDDQTVASLRVEMPRVVEFLTELHNTTVLEGEDATFKCVVSPEDVQLVWFMDNEAISLGDRFQATQNGLCHTLVIKKCQVLDSYCIARTVTVRFNLSLFCPSSLCSEAQVMFTRKKMEAVMAEEFGEATLETEISLETGEVQWMRQGVVIQAGPRHTLGQSGCKRSLTICNLNLSDRGTYRCETLHDRTQVKLNPGLYLNHLLLPLKHNILSETLERETASFEVELSHTDVEGIWQKDGIRVKPNNQWRVSTNGLVHGLTLSNLTLEDTGTIVFSAEGVRSSARLTIKGNDRLNCHKTTQSSYEHFPENLHFNEILHVLALVSVMMNFAASGAPEAEHVLCLHLVHALEIVQDLEDLYIQEDQNAVFMCEVSLEDVAGEWHKDGHKIRPTSTIKIRTEGTKHFLLMCNVKPEDVGEIRFVARDIESTAYLEVEELPVSIVKPLRDRTALEKHRVILECTVSSPRCDATWYKGRDELVPSDRVEIAVDGCCHKLVIQQVSVEDEGIYSIEVGGHTSEARLMVEGEVEGSGGRNMESVCFYEYY